MIQNNKIICIIPARKGSVGLPNKNMKNLLGKPLIQWTIESALKSKLISKIIVSTDSEKIISFVKKKYSNKVEVPFKRPKKYSGNNSPVSSTILHALNFYKKKKKEFEYIMLLEPTSPIRFSKDIDNAINKFLLKKNKYDGIISIGEVKLNPFLLKTIIKYKIKNLFKIQKSNLNRQNFKKVYFPFGLIYFSKIKIYIKRKTFYTNNSMFYKIKDVQCYEIDDINDFYCTETIMKKINL